jgi:HNH endonuclease
MSAPPSRKLVPRSTRFEVFKRDSFKCQYCGAAAPDVLLVIDHIEPVALDGTNDITNLITACVSCNSGKGPRRLSDDAAVAKARGQLEELQARREQLEMMMEWKKGLLALSEETIDHLTGYWHEKAPGFSPNEAGRSSLRKWVRRFSLEEVLHAMDIAADQYLEFTDGGTVTGDSWELAFGKIPGICRVNRDAKDDPDLRELYYIRGILKNRLGYFDAPRAIQWLKAARSWDVSLGELREMALQVRTWTAFGDAIGELIARQRQLYGEDEPGPAAEGG